MKNKKVIILDGDNTIWDTEASFVSQYHTIIKKIHKLFFINYVDFEIEEKDIENFFKEEDILKLFYSTFEYNNIAKKIVLFYTSLCSQNILKYNAKVEKKVYEILQGTIMNPPLYDDAIYFLSNLSEKYDLYLYTHGYDWVQNFKIKNTNVAKYLKGIQVEPLKKSKKNLEKYLKRGKLFGTHSVYYIGDSVKYDINPAISNGLTPIWIKRSGDGSKLIEEVKTVVSLTEAVGYINEE